jgi:hypothetical protein
MKKGLALVVSGFNWVFQMPVTAESYLKSARFLRISGFWHFFQICEIPLLSTIMGHGKCADTPALNILFIYVIRWAGA